MARYRDLEDMIGIITLAIVRQETEEEFFRRSARSSTSEIAKEVFSEIAEDLARYRESLEARRQRLLNALNDLKARQGDDLAKRQAEAITRDPVCEMKVDKDRCKFTSTYKGKEYRFCSEDCKKAFDAAPRKYVKV